MKSKRIWEHNRSQQALLMRLESLILRQAVETMAPEDAVNGLICQENFVIPLQIHANAPGDKAVMLTQIENLAGALMARCK